MFKYTAGNKFLTFLRAIYKYLVGVANFSYFIIQLFSHSKIYSAFARILTCMDLSNWGNPF